RLWSFAVVEFRGDEMDGGQKLGGKRKILTWTGSSRFIGTQAFRQLMGFVFWKNGGERPSRRLLSLFTGYGRLRCTAALGSWSARSLVGTFLSRRLSSPRRSAGWLSAIVEFRGDEMDGGQKLGGKRKILTWTGSSRFIGTQAFRQLMGFVFWKNGERPSWRLPSPRLSPGSAGWSDSWVLALAFAKITVVFLSTASTALHKKLAWPIAAYVEENGGERPSRRLLSLFTGYGRLRCTAAPGSWSARSLVGGSLRRVDRRDGLARLWSFAVVEFRGDEMDGGQKLGGKRKILTWTGSSRFIGTQAFRQLMGFFFWKNGERPSWRLPSPRLSPGSAGWSGAILQFRARKMDSIDGGQKLGVAVIRRNLRVRLKAGQQGARVLRRFMGTRACFRQNHSSLSFNGFDGTTQETGLAHCGVRRAGVWGGGLERRRAPESAAPVPFYWLREAAMYSCSRILVGAFSSRHIPESAALFAASIGGMAQRDCGVSRLWSSAGMRWMEAPRLFANSWDFFLEVRRTSRRPLVTEGRPPPLRFVEADSIGLGSTVGGMAWRDRIVSMDSIDRVANFGGQKPSAGKSNRNMNVLSYTRTVSCEAPIPGPPTICNKLGRVTR
ncbi:hypothetical protein C8R47DRAFT_1080981, partial [Mycena vitilis]